MINQKQVEGSGINTQQVINEQQVSSGDMQFEKMMSPEDVLARKRCHYGQSTWGPWLFSGVALSALTFMWWLVIYTHGVAPHH